MKRPDGTHNTPHTGKLFLSVPVAIATYVLMGIWRHSFLLFYVSLPAQLHSAAQDGKEKIFCCSYYHSFVMSDIQKTRTYFIGCDGSSFCAVSY